MSEQTERISYFTVARTMMTFPTVAGIQPEVLEAVKEQMTTHSDGLLTNVLIGGSTTFTSTRAEEKPLTREMITELAKRLPPAPELPDSFLAMLNVMVLNMMEVYGVAPSDVVGFEFRGPERPGSKPDLPEWMRPMRLPTPFGPLTVREVPGMTGYEVSPILKDTVPNFLTKQHAATMRFSREEASTR